MKSINLTAVLLVFTAGASVPLSVALNTTLGRLLKNPILSGFIVTLIASLFFMAVVFLSKAPRRVLSEFPMIPWYYWTGGIMFALYILILLFNTAKVGVGFTTSLVVAGQLAMSLALDHFGAFGMPQASISIGRIAGILTVLAGVALIKIF